MASGTVLGADGAVLTLPWSELSLDEVRILREYKKFLQRRGYREALYCNACFNADRHDGCEAHVTAGDILIKCRCRMVGYKGAE